MNNNLPNSPKIYHILHVDRLDSVIADGCLWSDAVISNRSNADPMTKIGMSKIKERRLELRITCYPDRCVGQCVPFYFCPRPIMLYVLYKGNEPELTYRHGQGPIVHLEADLHKVVKWADRKRKRWVFSLSNAGAYYVEFRNDLD